MGREVPAHDEEGEVMQCPADNGIGAGVVDMVKICGCEVDVMTSPTKKVDESNNAENHDTSSRRPNIDGIAKEEIFDG